MPYDIFSNTVKQKNADVNTIELIMNSEDCNRFIVCVILTNHLVVVMLNHRA